MNLKFQNKFHTSDDEKQFICFFIFQMNATNLATCFVPSLFNLNIMKMSVNIRNKDSILGGMFSPKRPRKQQSYIMPDTKDMEEQRIAIKCFSTMITHVKEIFEVILVYFIWVYCFNSI